MLTVINVGICIGFSLIALGLLYIAYNVIWNIPDDQLAKMQKYKVLCGVAAVLAIVVYFLFPSKWGVQNQYANLPTASRVYMAPPPPSVAAPTVAKPEEITQPIIYEQPSTAPLSRPVSTAQIEQQPVVQVDQRVAFTDAANDAIATELLNISQDVFQKQFSIQCLDVASSNRNVTGYGLNTSVVVVTGRFTVSSVNPVNGQTWAKTFSVSETVFPDEFQGLNSSTTTTLLADSLKDQISKDRKTLTILKNAFK